jgi:hypothetical protein
MATLLITLTRHSDGSSVLRCTRADGTTTWQKSTGRSGAFFPAHDLTHYAVETTLGCRHGFYGLLAAGWEIDDFADPARRGRIPEEARRVEAIVGVLDLQRATASECDARTLRARLGTMGANDTRMDELLALLDVTTLARIMEVRDELLERWAAIPAGGALTLEFTT